jgi:hypothetical protein
MDGKKIMHFANNNKNKEVVRNQEKNHQGKEEKKIYIKF